MTGVQRACLLGAVLWLLTHGPVVALLGLSRSHAPALSLLAVTTVCAVSAVLISPLTGRPLALSARAAWAAALVVPASGLAVMPFLDAESWRTYANWWPGEGQVIVAALVVRRRRLAALAAELGGAAVITGCVLADGAGSAAGPDVVTILALNQPATLWLPAALGIRAVFDRTSREVARYEADAGTATAEGAAAGARAASARSRRADLEVSVVPLLERVERAGSLPPGGSAGDRDELAQRALRLERQLRDDLGARTVLDTRLRAAVRGARGRGSAVDVVDDRRQPDEDGFVALVRPALAAALDACRGASATARLDPAGRLVTLAVDGSPAEVHQVADALAAAVPDGLDLVVDLEFGSLWAELSPRAGLSAQRSAGAG